MPSITVDASDLRRLSDRLDTVAARFNDAMAAQLAALAGEVETVAVEAIRTVTPVARITTPNPYFPTPPTPGQLRDSTMAVSRLVHGSLVTAVMQPAESAPDQAGRWGGFQYAETVIKGRGPVRPVYARALAGPGFGPRPFAKAVPPNPYPLLAEPAITSAVAGITARYGPTIHAFLVAP
jgi:hypothetical protein